METLAIAFAAIALCLVIGTLGYAMYKAPEIKVDENETEAKRNG